MDFLRTILDLTTTVRDALIEQRRSVSRTSIVRGEATEEAPRSARNALAVYQRDAPQQSAFE